MSVQVEVKTTVKGGFPVLAEASFICYDDGLELDALELFTTKGKPADWLSPSQEDLDRIELECREAILAKAEADAESYAEMRSEDLRWNDY